MSALSPQEMRRLIEGGATTRVDAPQWGPAFAVGQWVVTDSRSPLTHTRLPRYARGKRGQIVRVQGVYALPDSNALRAGPKSQYVYALRFSMAELWGPQGAADDFLTIDVWEDYIAPA